MNKWLKMVFMLSITCEKATASVSYLFSLNKAPIENDPFQVPDPYFRDYDNGFQKHILSEQIKE